MTSPTGKETIAIHILPYISRCKGNQTMKFVQLIKNNMRYILSQSHAQSVVKKLVRDPFLKKLKLCISLSQQYEASYSLFLL